MSSPPPASDSCYYYTEESCRSAAEALGLEIGGAGWSFAGNYERSGCYYYECSHCLYGGIVYFGRAGSQSDMESSYFAHSEKRLDCMTTVENMSKDTSFWCMFPNKVCSPSFQPWHHHHD